MIQPDDIVDSVNREREQSGGSYTLWKLLERLDRIYKERDRVDEEIEPELAIVAGKFKVENRRRFDIGIYPSCSLFQPVEILLTYPFGLRNWSLKECETQLLEFSPETGIDFSEIRATKWFRRYKHVKPVEFVCRLRTSKELEEYADALSNMFENGL